LEAAKILTAPRRIYFSTLALSNIQAIDIPDHINHQNLLLGLANTKSHQMSS
jgi:hypothetical protein